MKTKSTFTLRLEISQLQELAQIGARTGQDTSTLVRVAVQALVDHYHASGNRLILPLSFGGPEPPPETESKIGSHIARSVAAEDPPEVTRPVIPLLSKSVSYRRRKK